MQEVPIGVYLTFARRQISGATKPLFLASPIRKPRATEAFGDFAHRLNSPASRQLPSADVPPGTPPGRRARAAEATTPATDTPPPRARCSAAAAPPRRPP